jgi:signal transduction histidine kinase
MDHASWTARDGAPRGIMHVAQAPDGTLWLGAAGGLFTFDGHTFEAFQPPAGEPELPPETVRSLLVTRDGALWVGYLQSGVARIAKGRVTHFRTTSTIPFSAIDQLREAQDGSVWGIANLMALVRFGRGDSVWRVEAPPPEVANTRIGGVYVDASNVLWLAQGGRLFRRPLPGTTYTATDVRVDGVSAFAETPGGDIWMLDYDVRRFVRTQRVDRGGRLLVSLRNRIPRATDADLRYTEDGSLIVLMDGLHRFRADELTGRPALPVGPADDSTGSARAVEPGARTLLLDSDHNIWLGGRRGLDRFRAPRLVPFRAGYMPGHWTVCADARGDVFLTSNDRAGLYRVAGARARAFPNTRGIRYLSCGKDGTVRAWDRDTLWEVHGSRLKHVPFVPGAPPFAVIHVVAMPDRTLYALVGGNPAAFGGIWEYKNGRWTKRTAEGVLQYAGWMAHVDSRNRLWVGYTRGRVGRPLDGRVYGSGTPGLGDVFAFLETSRGFLAGGSGGLAVLRDTSFEMLSFADRASTRGVAGLVESRDGDLWLNAARGIVRVRAAELEAGLANPRYPMKSERITEGDFTGPARAFGSTTTAARAADGTLWFSMLGGVVRYDPDAPSPGGKPPILSIRSITADRVPLGSGGTFDPQPRTLAIQYFGVDLTAPDRVRYRYKLDGFDDAWQDAGGRTEAIYTRPGPGTYTFRVMAANEAGVWTPPVVSAPFTILPSFYETRWFAALAAISVAALAWLAYTLRVRTITRLVQARAEERADERVRIARELHDTLLSGMAGLMMGLGAVAKRARAPGGVDPRELDELCDETRRTLVEARDAVVAMRTSTDARRPLDARLGDAARRIFRGTAIDVRVIPSGAPRPLPPDLDEQVMRVASEAMTNARTHADCRAVEVTCAYGRGGLVVGVRDDGRGFDPAVATANGHYGVRGMRERAAAIGAQLAVDSAPGRGTTVRLDLPARPTD